MYLAILSQRLYVMTIAPDEEPPDMLLSESDSDSDDTVDETPRKLSRCSNAHHELFEEQTTYIRAKRMYLEKKYAILSKIDSLVDRIQISIKVQTSRPPSKQQRTKVDDDIEESLLT
ncbi:unnamed protein product [Cylicocyclus nassatus]|uniref:Uncharacterized protein n=1 Tax=Cylicocyclus nassatus TaxID=53992 RepID=A0AA36H4X5_CYLNA|nr:unnamed protein product [Cylicocyclus nassatus]